MVVHPVASRVIVVLLLLVTLLAAGPSGPAAAAAQQNCDAAYPDVCVPPVEEAGDLDCPDIGYSNITVNDPDPHFLDTDLDGIGCESTIASSSSGTSSGATEAECDPSYPYACLPPAPPDLNCDDIGFAVAVVKDPSIGATDPHKLDPDGDGIGCASYGDGGASTISSAEGDVAECDPSYPDICLPAPPPDLNCDDIGEPINVLHNAGRGETDPHKLDPDGDGVACRS